MEVNINTKNWIEIVDISNNLIITNDKYIKVFEVQPINYDLKTDMEKKAILNSYNHFLNSCNFDLQILIKSKKEGVNEILENINNNYSNIILNSNAESIKNIQNLQKEYLSFLNNQIQLKKTSNKKYYILTYISHSLFKENNQSILNTKNNSSYSSNFNSNKISNFLKNSINQSKTNNLIQTNNLNNSNNLIQLNNNSDFSYNILEINSSYLKEFSERKKVIIETLSKCQNEVTELDNNQLLEFLNIYYGGVYGNN
ncbi:MAG: hypothetical protein ACTTGJ_02245 [Clostridium sp.]